MPVEIGVRDGIDLYYIREGADPAASESQA
jgi:hypothetical protein